MTTTLELSNNAPTTMQQHAHRWRIDEPNGPESVGQCRTCGETKAFRNWIPEDPPSFGSGPRLAA